MTERPRVTERPRGAVESPQRVSAQRSTQQRDVNDGRRERANGLLSGAVRRKAESRLRLPEARVFQLQIHDFQKK